MHPEIVTQTESRIAEVGGTVIRDAATDVLWVNQEFSVSLVLARCNQLLNGHSRWKIRLDTSLLPDVSVVVRLAPGNEQILDYFLLPRLDICRPHISLADRNPIEFESYRFESLDYLHSMAARVRLRLVA